MRFRTIVCTFPLLFLILGLFPACDLNEGEGTLESLELNYRQIRAVNRDAESITADFVRNLRDTLAVSLTDSALSVEETIRFRLYDDQLDSMEKSTFLVIDQIDEHLKVMESMAIKNPETGRFESKGEEDASHRYWKNKSNADKIRKALTDYEGALIRYSGNPDIRIDEIYDNSLWLQFSNKRPVIAYLALLEGIKANLFAHERKALQMYFRQFGTPYFRSNNFVVLNQPEAQIVTAGMPFKSTLRVGLTSTRMKSRFEGDGLTANPDSVTARIELGADGSLIPEGKYTGIQDYSATIMVPRADGGYLNMQLKERFTVVRPIVRISSQRTQVLYRKCENILAIDVPSLEGTYRPKIEASEAEVVLQEGNEKQFSIIPAGDSCLITVNTLLGDSSIKVDALNYRVIDPPKPSIELWVNDQLHNGFSLIPRTSRLLLKINPDPEFLEAYPGDARYGFTTVDIMIQRDMGTPDVVKTINGLTREAIKGIPIDLGPEVEQAFPGTAIYLRINEIFRKNFTGQNLSENRFTESERIIGLVVR